MNTISFERVLARSFTLLLLPAAQMDGQAYIRGRVVQDSVSRPVEGAQVLVSALNIEVRTDANGLFAIPLEHEGKVRLFVRRVGLESRSMDVDVARGDTANVLVTLPTAPAILAPVSVQ